MKAELKEKIDALVQNIPNLRTQEGEAAGDRLLAEAIALASSAEEKKEAGAYLRREMRLRHKRDDVDVAGMFGPLGDALSYAYIAQRYFGKGQPWFSQRLNRSTVNGKPAAFTGKELTVLAEALQDLSQRLSDVSVKIHQSI